MHFCAVFDGHGPVGHRVAQQVRDMLPSKLCSIFKQYSQVNGTNFKTEADEKTKENYENADCEDGHKNPFFSSWKNILIKSFEKVDEDLCDDVALDSYCSGSTTVAVLKQVYPMHIFTLRSLYGVGD